MHRRQVVGRPGKNRLSVKIRNVQHDCAATDSTPGNR